MTEHLKRRPQRARAWTTTLLLVACAASAAPSYAASANIIRYIQPVVSRGHVITYAVCLHSTAEFPMRNEVITLSIGRKTFINSSYVQGGDLHTIIFSLTQNDYQALKNGDPVSVFYGQSDAFNTAAQWSFGTLHGLPLHVAPRPIVPMPLKIGTVSVHPMMSRSTAAASTQIMTKRGKQ